MAPRGLATRPTSDRVREAVFGALEARGRVRGARVLDAFAGTGALGLEALSRGAREVTFVEPARGALEALRKNVASLGVAARVLEARAGAAAKALGEERFDLVLCDPPWADVPRLGATLEALAGLVADGGALALEHDKRTAAPDLAGLHALGTRRYGDTAVTFYERDEPPSESARPNEV